MSPATASSVEVCSGCKQWTIAAGDVFCGLCGRCLFGLTSTPPGVTLIEGIAEKRRVILTNDGDHEVRVLVEPEHGGLEALVIEGEELMIPAGERRAFTVHLAPERLPEGFASRKVALGYRLTAGASEVALRLPIHVKSRPRPQAIPESLDFGQLSEGVPQTREVKLVNRGGAALRLDQAHISQPGGEIALQSDSPLPLILRSGYPVSFRVTWTPLASRSKRSADESLEFRFANKVPQLNVGLVASRQVFTVSPSSVRLVDELQGHSQAIEFTLQNADGPPVRVRSIGANADWLEVAANDLTPCIAENDNYRFELLIRTAGLAPGDHSAELTIAAEGFKSPLQVPVNLHVIEPVEYLDYIGIDFGTSNSVVAVVGASGTGTIDLVEDGEPKSPLIPSVLTFRSSPNSFLVGSAAAMEARAAPGNAIHSIKRVLGGRRKREFLGQDFSPEEIAARILRSLIDRAERTLFQRVGRYLKVKRAIVTVPANFFGQQIEGVVKACEQAGLDPEPDAGSGVIVNEPSAAALFFLSRLHEDGRHADLQDRISSEAGLHLLVYDHGGGTLDINVAHVRREPSGPIGIRVLSNLGENAVGGDSIDRLLANHLLEKVKKKYGNLDEDLVFSTRSNLEKRARRENWDVATRLLVEHAREQWRVTSEEVKIGLSEEKELRFEIASRAFLSSNEGRIKELTDRPFATKLKRTDLGRAAEELLLRCGALVTQALKIARISPTQVDYILHTGRQSLMPSVQEIVKAKFPDLPEDRVILDRDQLKVCVAKGAALYGQLRGKGNHGVVFRDEGRRLPHGYGVMRAEGFELVYDPIIPKAASYPGHWGHSIDAKNVAPDGVYDLRILEHKGGHTMARGDGVRDIGGARVDTTMNGEEGCQLEFSMDSNRLLHVKADGQVIPVQVEVFDEQEDWEW